MTTWGNICRICSSPADYEIFAKIPTYLHGSTNEFLNWQKPINLLLEETTGLKNSTEDGLPRYICAPCISYLKHAVTFREQCIKNALSLKLAELYQQKSVKHGTDKENALFTAADLRYVEQRPVHNLLLNNNQVKLEPTDKVHKQLLNQTAPQLGGNCEQRIRYLNVLFDKDHIAGLRGKLGNGGQEELPTTSAGGSGNGTGAEDEEDYPAASSSDENEENALSRRDKNCYNYSETNFEDDDPMANVERDIKVNIPEPMWKERKCPACAKRFMFEDTYKTHVENCVEHQFVLLINEVTQLLDIRRQKMVSPHEFIRRMIFALHKTCSWLQAHSMDTQLADKLQQVKLGSNGVQAQEAIEVAELNIKTEPDWCIDTAEVEPPPFKRLSGAATPITMENNVLYAIERSASRNSQSTPVVQKPIPIRGKPTTKAPTSDDITNERATFLEKLQRAADTPIALAEPLPATPTSSAASLPFSARCGQCNLVFDSVSDLEVHNIMHHNAHTAASMDVSKLSTEDAQRRRIIALFEDDI